VNARKAGTREDFRYSNPMRRAGFIWDETSLREYLADPQAKVKRNRMPFGGFSDPKDIDDVVAYLATLKGTGHSCRPAAVAARARPDRDRLPHRSMPRLYFRCSLQAPPPRLLHCNAYLLRFAEQSAPHAPDYLPAPTNPPPHRR
jgi:hypothetical protein